MGAGHFRKESIGLYQQLTPRIMKNSRAPHGASTVSSRPKDTQRLI